MYVVFCAYVPFSKYFRSADLYISGTYSDGSSVSLMEALASGVPVLISNIPGNREWVQPEREGWLFPAGNSAEIAKGILFAARKTPDELREIGNSGRLKAEQKADWRKNQMGIEKAYAIAQKQTKELQA